MSCINPNSKAFKDILSNEPNVLLAEIEYDNIYNSEVINYQNLTDEPMEDYIESEKTIRDLAAKVSDRIGVLVRFESDRTKQYKGKLENGVAYINLAYATLDTPIHEILGHPIIRAIKNATLSERSNQSALLEYKNAFIVEENGEFFIKKEDGSYWSNFETKEEAEKELKILQKANSNETSQLYQNLVKELETGRGKEVLDRIKRDYKYKVTAELITDRFGRYGVKEGNSEEFSFDTKEEAESQIRKINSKEYTLEEQQEEAIVELLGLMTAEKLDKVKDGKLISLLKRLLKEMKAFMKQLLGQKEVDIDKLPDNMTLGDIADLLAYSNSKLILPGNEVIYTTPDNEKFKTYQEASNHISELVKSVKDVDLSDVDLKDKNKVTSINEINVDNFAGVFESFIKVNGNWYNQFTFDPNHDYSKDEVVPDNEIIAQWNARFDDVNEYSITKGGIEGFIEKNKPYEQSKEIIEEWKKVNNIQYNPEEVYSRGQGFYSISGAFADFDVELMFQNLLAHIEDNKKSGGQFTVSATTTIPDHSKSTNSLVTKNYSKNIYYKIFPKHEDILWATPKDCASGSVIDAAEKVGSKLGKEITGVSYTKYPSLTAVEEVQPSLAEAIDKTSTNRNFYNYNELGINLTYTNFRLEYDEDIPYTTKKIIDSINSILDQKYGKLVKPEIKKGNPNIDFYIRDKKTGKIISSSFGENQYKASQNAENLNRVEERKTGDSTKRYETIRKDTFGIQPTQTNETLKESIDSVKNKVVKPKYSKSRVIKGPGGINMEWAVEYSFDAGDNLDTDIEFFNTEEEAIRFEINLKVEDVEKKEYTSQALINTKIAALKEVAKKQPRSLIRSEVRRINTSSSQELYDQFGADELPFQKVPQSELQEVDNNLDNSDNNSTFVDSENKEIYNDVSDFMMFNDIYNLEDIQIDNIEYKDDSGQPLC